MNITLFISKGIAHFCFLLVQNVHRLSIFPSFYRRKKTGVSGLPLTSGDRSVSDIDLASSLMSTLCSAYILAQIEPRDRGERLIKYLNFVMTSQNMVYQH